MLSCFVVVVEFFVAVVGAVVAEIVLDAIPFQIPKAIAILSCLAHSEEATDAEGNHSQDIPL